MNIKEVRELFLNHKNAEEARGMEAYMLNQFKYFGIKTPERKKLSAILFANDKKTDEIDWSFVFESFNQPERELQYFAINYLERHSKQLTTNDLPNLKKLITIRSWWDTVDLIDKLVGNIASPETMINWSKDENFWIRRVSINHQLQFKDKTNKGLLETIIKNNLGQKEFFINKAIGWALREYSKTNPNWVKEFVQQNRQNMSNLSIRESLKIINKK